MEESRTQPTVAASDEAASQDMGPQDAADASPDTPLDTPLDEGIARICGK